MGKLFRTDLNATEPRCCNNDKCWWSGARLVLREQEAWSDKSVLEVSCGQGTQTSSSRDEHDKRDEYNIPVALFEVERNDDTRSLDSGGSIAGV